MKISSKLVLIQLIFICGLIVFGGAWELYNSYQTRLFLKSTHDHTERLSNQVLSSFHQGIEQPLNDNSEWDETSKYLLNPNRKFEVECINTLLGTFAINSAVYYNASGSLVYKVDDSTTQDLGDLLKPLNIRSILSIHNPKCHFFLGKENRIYEVFGATVVPTNDREHISSPKGYLLFIKYWDTAFLKRFGDLTQSHIVTDFSLQKPLETSQDGNVSKDLKDWKGNSVARIVLERNDPFIREWKERNNASAYHAMLFGVLMILIISYVFRRWISKPLLSTIDDLRYTEERFRQVAENAGEWIWEVDIQGRYTYSNPIVEKILGYSASELIDQKYWYEFFPSNLRSTLKTEIEESIRQGRIFRDYVNPHQHRNGAIVTLQTSCSPFYDKDGKMIGYRGTAMNVTEHKRVMQDLQAALNKAEENDRLKTAFLNNISHEIRTPMNAIVGYSDLLVEAMHNPAKQKAFTEIITTAAHQLLSIIDDIISISTLEAGQEVYRPQNISLNALLKNLKNQFQLKAEKKGLGLEISTSLLDNDSLITTDETKLVQILSNLLINAFKFTREGYILFGYTLKSNKLEFFVRDTGIGIPREMHEIIFDRFRQADSSVIREYGGTGLGLSISKAYVELMGGKIWLESEPGEGSVFYFDIPYIQATLSNGKDKFISSPGILESPDTKTILVAEDEELNFLLIKEMVSWNNWNILKATNGQEAVDICQGNPAIDLVLMDLKMPVMDGFQATQVIKSMRPKLPVIVQSAYIREEDKNKAFRHGCDDYITKPFNKKIFAELIEKYMSS